MLLPFPDEFFFLAQWWFRIATTIADKPLDPKATPAKCKKLLHYLFLLFVTGTAKAPACSLDKPGRDGIMKNRKGAATAVSHQSSICSMLTVWGPPSGQHALWRVCRPQRPSITKNFQRKFPIQASPPFAGKWLTAVYVTAPLSDPFRVHPSYHAAPQIVNFCCPIRGAAFYFFTSSQNSGFVSGDQVLVSILLRQVLPPAVQQSPLA